MMHVLYTLIAATVTVAALSACAGDPVLDQQVSDLGGEADGVEPGPLHRAGQPCMVCHQVNGAARAFTVAGTVVKSKDDTTGVEGITVELLDTSGARRTAITNSVGNFFVLADDWTPLWPVATRIVLDGGKDRRMQTPIFREGSCAKCHGTQTGTRSAGPVTVSP